MINFFKKASLLKLILFLIIIGFLTYLSSFTNQFVWDDDHFFYQNVFTQNLFHIKEIFTSNTTAGAGVTSNYYRPFTTLTFAFDHALWGWNPIGLHLTNTVFHIANGILLFFLLFLLRFGKISSFVVSLLFLIHPIQTEAVTYLSSRGDILYTTFLLISLHLFRLSFIHEQVGIIIKKKRLSISQNMMLLISFLLFPLSILSKEGALTTVPLYAGIFLLIALQQKLSLKQVHTKYRKQFITLLLIGWITLVYFGLRLTVLNFGSSLNYSEDHSDYGTHLSIRLLTFLKTLIIYIRLLIVPYPLYLERSTEIVTSLLNPWVWGSLSIIAASIWAGIHELRKKHTGWIFFALIIIFANLLSVSGIIPMTGLLRENWLYMPMIGFYMILITCIRLFSPSKFIKSFKKATITWILFILYCLILMAMTIQQNYNWRDRIAYFEHNLRFTNTARLHLNLGNAYIGKGDYTKALTHLEEAIKLDDSYPQTHYNIANIYLRQNKNDLAEQELLFSLAMDPNYLYAYPVLLNIYEKEKKPEKALPYLKRLMQIYPNDLKVTIMYAESLYKAGKRDEAEKQFKEALRLSHNDPKLIEAINKTKGGNTH